MIRSTLLAFAVLIGLTAGAAAQGCGPANPNCVVPTAPAGTNNNQAASTAFVYQAFQNFPPIAQSVALTGSAALNNVNTFTITSDTEQCAFCASLYSQWSYGGASARGARSNIFGWNIQTAPNTGSGTTASVGGTFVGQTNTGDGGGLGTEAGTYFGANNIVRATAHVVNAFSVENDLMTDANYAGLYSAAVTATNFAAKQALNADAGLIFYTGGRIAAAGGGGPWGGNVVTAASASVGAAGSGYTNGTQTLTLSGIACTTLPQISVTVSGNAVVSVNSITSAGSCGVAPAAAVAVTGGGGTGATLTMTWSGSPSTGFHVGILFAELKNGLPPIDATGCVMCAYLGSLPNFYASTGIDLSSFIISGSAWKSTGATLDGSGNWSIASLTLSSTLTTAITGSTQCLHVNSSGVVSGTGSDCGAGGGGNVSNSGTPTINQIAQWTDATHIKGITTITVSLGGTGQTSLTANAFLTGNTTSGINQVAITGLVLGNGASAPTAYGGASCTNQALTALSAAGAATCSSITNAFLTAGSFTGITGVGTLTAGATGAGFTVALSTSTITGTLGVANGGTGQTSLTSQAILTGNGTSGINSTGCSIGTNNAVICSSSVAFQPQWVVYNNVSDVNAAYMFGAKSRGASPVQSGDALFNVFASACYGTGGAGCTLANALTNTNFTATAGFSMVTTGAPVAGNLTVPTKIIFYSSDGTASLDHTMTFGSDGSLTVQGGAILSMGATGGIGYATGAGGAVTQAASRTTNVTLNAVTGDITLVSAAGSATLQSFTVSNTTVAATDTVHVVQKSGTDLYEIFVTQVGANSFKITFGTTGGTTTEQPVFHFNVIKGANSFLLNRDLDPAANDNTPAFLMEKVG